MEKRRFFYHLTQSKWTILYLKIITKGDCKLIKFAIHICVENINIEITRKIVHRSLYRTLAAAIKKEKKKVIIV